MPSYGGQGPSMSALAQQNQQHPPFGPPPVQKQIQLFVGSISAGVSDEFMTQLLSVRALSLLYLGDYADLTTGMWTSKKFQAADNACE